MLGGKAYIFGGGSLGQQEQAELLEVAVAGGRAEAAVLPRGPARQGHSMVPWAGRLVVFGGTGPSPSPCPPLCFKASSKTSWRFSVWRWRPTPNLFWCDVEMHGLQGNA